MASHLLYNSLRSAFARNWLRRTNGAIYRSRELGIKMMTNQTAAADVLVVDDDDGIRETLAELLNEMGYAVATASDGREALDYLSKHPHPHLIITDFMMPIMTGQEFRRKQLQMPELARIPTVMISASEEAKLAAREGSMEYLKKPLNLDRLTHTLNRHCSFH